MERKRITILLTVVGVVLAALLIFNVAGIGSVRAETPQDSAEKTVTVYGQGKVSIDPDVSYITFGYENNHKDPQEAQKVNEAQMTKIIKAMKDLGIKDSQLQTVTYRVSEHRTSNGKADGFEVYNMIQVETDKIDKVGDIIKVAYDAGANKFWDVRFDVIKRQDAYLDALDLAMHRAREKADKLAGYEDKKVVEVLTIEEGAENNRYTFSSPYTNFVASSSASDSLAGGSIASGEMEINAVVHVTYRLN